MKDAYLDMLISADKLIVNVKIRKCSRAVQGGSPKRWSRYPRKKEALLDGSMQLNYCHYSNNRIRNKGKKIVAFCMWEKMEGGN